MKKSMKPLVIILSIVIILGLGLFGYFTIKEMVAEEKQKKLNEKKADSVTKKKPKAGEQRKEIKGEVTEKELNQYKKDDKNPFGETIRGKKLKDIDVQEYIHGMFHQKVVAEKNGVFMKSIQRELNGY